MTCMDQHPNVSEPATPIVLERNSFSLIGVPVLAIGTSIVILIFSWRIRESSYYFLGIPSEFLKIFFILIIDLLALMSVLYCLWTVRKEKSLAFTNVGISKIDTWGNTKFIKWSDVDEISFVFSDNFKIQRICTLLQPHIF
jgi:hypothetical protein